MEDTSTLSDSRSRAATRDSAGTANEEARKKRAGTSVPGEGAEPEDRVGG